jgi:hypothetical protein
MIPTNRVPHSCRVLCDRVGILTSVDRNHSAHPLSHVFAQGAGFFDLTALKP